MPNFPEIISENIIRFILTNKANNISTRNCKSGDLYSTIEGRQECKCFTGEGPSSFSPSANWDVLYFLDATDWLNKKFILYKINLSNTSLEWKNIKVNKKETFEDQIKNKRRPRINWKSLHLQVKDYCTIVYDGYFDDIFN